MTTAHYRLLSPAGEASEDGSADVVVADGTFVLTPKAGDVLRVPFGQIASVTEGEQFTLRIGLAQGTVIELSRMGAMRTQVLAELRDAHADAAARTASAVGEADIFSGFAGGEQVELRLYDDALLVIGSAATQRVSFSFVRSVEVGDYVVTVQAAGSDSVVLTRLGNRTGEFDRALSDRVAAARGRTSAFLSALLPGLDPMSLRQAAGLLRDGVAVPVSTLNGVHAELAGTLVEVAGLPERRAVVADLAQRGELAIGFRQVTSAHKDAVGVTAWRDSAATPHIGEHESPGGTFKPGFAGMMAAGVMAGGPGAFGPGGYGGGYGGGFGGFGGGFGLGGFGGGPGGGYGGYGAGPYGYRDSWDYGDYWAYRALGAGMSNASQARQMSTRPNLTRGTLTPASEDLSALRIGGEEPTVLAFLLASVSDRVVFEVLNLAEPPTLVFRAAGLGQDAFAVINRALVDSGFAPPAAAGGGLTAPARRVGEPALLSDLFVGQAPHGENWSAQLSSLLAD